MHQTHGPVVGVAGAVAGVAEVEEVEEDGELPHRGIRVVVVHGVAMPPPGGG